MRKFFQKARRLLKNPTELLATLSLALKKAYAKRKKIYSVYEDFLMLFRFVKAWAVGDYREMSKASVLWALAAILYFLSPIDIIPDFLPGGYIDDIIVIGFVVARIRQDLDKFKEWEALKSAKDNAESLPKH